jgi:hypothetical protein
LTANFSVYFDCHSFSFLNKIFSRKDSETKKSMEVVVKKPSFCTSLLGLLDLEAPGGGRVGGLWRLDDHLLISLQIAGGKTGRWWASLANF